MIDLIIFLTLLALGYGAGTWAEKRHYRSIARREGRHPQPACRYIEVRCRSGK